jgi:hypothetical protein
MKPIRQAQGKPKYDMASKPRGKTQGKPLIDVLAGDEQSPSTSFRQSSRFSTSSTQDQDSGQAGTFIPVTQFEVITFFDSVKNRQAIGLYALGQDGVIREFNGGTWNPFPITLMTDRTPSTSSGPKRMFDPPLRQAQGEPIRDEPIIVWLLQRLDAHEQVIEGLMQRIQILETHLLKPASVSEPSVSNS